MVRTWLGRLLGILAACALIAGCGGGGSGSSSSPPRSGPNASQSSPTTLPSGSGTTVAAGELVKGFPTQLIPLMPGATLKASAVVPRGGLEAVSMAATSSASAADILQFYKQSLTTHGFADSGATPAGAAGGTFTRADGEIVTVVILPQNGQQTFSVGGTIKP